jgi:hypothetical protein
MTNQPKRARDLNQWAKRMVDIATGEVSDRVPTPEEQGKRPVAVSSGARGGEARARVITRDERAKIAKKAANARWGKEKAAPAD